MTDVVFLSNMFWQNEDEARTYTVSLSKDNPNPNRANNLVECGTRLTSDVNVDHETEVHCGNPERSLYVIFTVVDEPMIVCEMFVFSRLADFLMGD